MFLESLSFFISFFNFYSSSSLASLGCCDRFSNLSICLSIYRKCGANDVVEFT